MPITLLSKEILRSKFDDPGAATPSDYVQFRFRVQNTTTEDIKSFDNTFIEVTKGGVTKQYVFKISVPAGTTSSLFTTIKYVLPEDFWSGAVTVKFIFPISASFGQNIVTNNFNGDWEKYYLGCTDPAALNYNPDADTNDGSCMLPVYGCTNPVALNYDPQATNDDGSCILPVPGCTNPEALNYDAGANVDDGSCILPIPGCTNPAALNYDPNANTDDGSCILPVYGCTDPTAENYNPAANTDDGSCTYPPVAGCTNPNAQNYNPNATVDDGSCVFDNRTGLKGWATLQEYDILNYQLTGNEKDNDPEDPDFVPPVYDPNACPPGNAPL